MARPVMFWPEPNVASFILLLMIVAKRITSVAAFVGAEPRRSASTDVRKVRATMLARSDFEHLWNSVIGWQFVASRGISVVARSRHLKARFHSPEPGFFFGTTKPDRSCRGQPGEVSALLVRLGVTFLLKSKRRSRRSPGRSSAGAPCVHADALTFLGMVFATPSLRPAVWGNRRRSIRGLLSAV
jgi:hypothetical protein